MKNLFKYNFISFITIISLFIFLNISISNAQVFKDWSFDLTTLGELAPTITYRHTKPIIVDDSGNTYIAHYATTPGSGIRITKIKNDASIDWTASFGTDFFILYFKRNSTGDLYISASNSTAHQLLFLKFNKSGEFIWSHSYTDPDLINSDWFGGGLSPYLDIDETGNLWFTTIASPVDSFCYANNNGVAQYHAANVILYKLDSFTGNRSLVHRMTSDVRYKNSGYRIYCTSDGIVNLNSFSSDYCLDDTCAYLGCDYQDRDNNYADVQVREFIKRFNSSGNLIDSSQTYVTGDFIEKDYYKGRDGNLYYENFYRSMEQYDPANGNNVIYTSFTKSGSWTSPNIPNRYGRVYSVDEQGDLLASLKLWGQDDSQFNPEIYYLFDGSTGALKWSKYFNYECYLDRFGNTFGSLEGAFKKINLNGNVVWAMETNKPVGTPIYVDTSESLYTYQYQKYINRYITNKKLVIRDAKNDSIPNMDFDLIKITQNLPHFVEDTVGIFTTDFYGCFNLKIIDSSRFEIETSNGLDTLELDQTIKISRHIATQPSVKHTVILPNQYTIHLDNGKFDENGVLSFDDLNEESKQSIILDHTEIRYNLLVSVQWNAEEEYLYGLQKNFRAMSNYLYDVTDGQVRLDEIKIYDNSEKWHFSDVWIYSSNIFHPKAIAGGIRYSDNKNAAIKLPRMFFGGLTDREDSYVYQKMHNLNIEVSNDYRTKAHEFGHYAFGFYDEYRFWDETKQDWIDDRNLKCQSVDIYGFMQYQYYSSGEWASEMSISDKYSDPDCQNTKQYGINSSSCWDFLEQIMEGDHVLHDRSSTSLYIPIIKPGDPERSLPSGYDYFPGPNNMIEYSPSVLNYDVGSLVRFTIPVTAPPSNRKSQLVNVYSVNPGGAEVILNKKIGNGWFVTKQGKTNDFGLIYVLGMDPENDKAVSGSRKVELVPSNNKSLSSNYKDVWLFGQTDGVAADTMVIDMSPIAGEYPLICAFEIVNGTANLKLHTANTFSDNPTVEMRRFAEEEIVYNYNLSNNIYTAEITDSLGSSGSLRTLALDNNSTQFYFNAFFEIDTIDHSLSELQLAGNLGNASVSFNSNDADLQKASLLSTIYPVIKNGLPPTAVQAGSAQSLSVYPAGSMTSAVMTINYDDSELKIMDNTLADETSLQIYHWDNNANQWQIIGGVVDTSRNTISASISNTGEYAAFTANIITDVEENDYGNVLPYRFEISQNYPNPFNPVTAIEYKIPEKSHVLITVYNILGEKVKTLVNEYKNAGTYTINWDATNSNGNKVSSGVYLYKFEAGNFSLNKKMLLLK